VDEVIPPDDTRFGQSNHRQPSERKTSNFPNSLEIGALILSNISYSDLTANPIPALTRGAGECTVSVGSRCPRL
jgi:hypothetical protein